MEVTEKKPVIYEQAPIQSDDLGLTLITWWCKGKPAINADEYAYCFLRSKVTGEVYSENIQLLKAIQASPNGEVEIGVFTYFLSVDKVMLRRRRRL